MKFHIRPKSVTVTLQVSDDDGWMQFGFKTERHTELNDMYENGA